MPRLRRVVLRAAAVWCALILASTGGTAVASDEHVDASRVCLGNIAVGDIEDNHQPVILVHGFKSDEGTWRGDPSFEAALTADPNAFVKTFNYGHVSTEWWGHPDIGIKLADLISCMYEASVDAGGPGKVAVVAHSMGGLATRCAVSAQCSGRPGIAERVGLVVTLGTPNLGSPLRVGPVGSFAQTTLGFGALRALCRVKYSGASLVAQMTPICDAIESFLTSHAGIAFTPGSRELVALAGYPEGITVRALAGRIQLGHSIFLKPIRYDIGDAVVNVDSALAGATPEAPGGTSVVDCGLLAGPRVEGINFKRASLPTCWHGSETKSEPFIQDVVSTLKSYMADNVARADDAAQRKLDERAARGVLPAPTGPSIYYEGEGIPYPFAARLISAGLLPELRGEPAPAGWSYLLMAVQVRGLLPDRGIRAPAAFMFDVQWPEPENCRVEDSYACSQGMGFGFSSIEMLTDYMPSDATELLPAPWSGSDVVIPPGEAYDVVLYQLVPEGKFTLENGRLKLGLGSFGVDKRQWLSFAGLP